MPMMLIYWKELYIVEFAFRKVRVGKNLFDMFPIRNGLKQGAALSPLLFNFALEYAIMGVQVN